MSSRSHVEVVEMKAENKSENYLGLELTEVNRCEGWGSSRIVQGDNSIKSHKEHRKKEALKEVDNAFNIQHA